MTTLSSRPSRRLTLNSLIFGLLLLTCFLSQPAQAITKSLAGVIDWHKPLIGIPRPDIPPAFHRISNNQETILTVTDSNVFASLNIGDGSIRWRQKFEVDDVIHSYKADKDVALVLSGSDESVARLFSTETGHLIWEAYLGQAHLFEPLKLGRPIAFNEDQVLVLSGGNQIKCLHRQTGVESWEWVSDTAGSTFTQIVVESEGIRLIGLTHGFASNSLSYILLKDGKPTHDIGHIPSSLESPTDVVTTADSLVWFDKKKHEVNAIKSGQTSRQSIKGTDVSTQRGGKQADYVSILATGLESKGYLLALRDNDSADIIKVTEGKLQVVFTFERGDPLSRGPSLWSGYQDAKGMVWVVRMYWSHGLHLMQVESYNIEHPDGFVYTGHTFAFKHLEHGVVLSSAFLMTTQPPIIDRFQALIVTSTGSIQLWRQEEHIWTRQESLADIVAISVLELPEKKVEEVQKVLGDESFTARAVRHVADLKNLPGYLVKFVARFTSGSYKNALSSKPLTIDALYRDQFGFQKLAIVATSTGKLFALDTAHGNIVWETLLGPSVQHQSDIDVKGLWSVREYAEGFAPVVATVLTIRHDHFVETVALHIDAFTGQIISPTGESARMFVGIAATVFPLPAKHCKTKIRALAVVDAHKRVHPFPWCKKIEASVKNITSDLTFHVTSPAGVTGYKMSPLSKDERFPSTAVWQVPLPNADRVNVVPTLPTTVASYGRVLGDRSTLYKYLNPHLLAISSQAGESASIMLVDSTTGEIVFSSAVSHVAPNEHVHVTLVENWLIYTYVEQAHSDESTGGQRLVSVELFENVNATTPLPVARTFIIPSLVKSLSTTSSRYGITNKDLVFVNEKDQIVSISRRLLDPRRPDVPSNLDKEEMLIPYDPMLGIDPKRTLSHETALVGIRNVVSSPALLESTSILIGYGLDLFGSRTTPSGTFDILSDAFNKPQLLLTILGLLVGLAFANPAVDRKILRARWY